MTKKDLADVVYNVHGGLSRKESAALIDAILSAIKDSLVDGDKVQVSRFGTFHVQHKNKRKGVNPLTGESIVIPAHKSVMFKPSSYLKDIVNS